MTTSRPGSERPGQQRRLGAERPFLLTSLVVATIGLVMVSAGWAQVVLDLQMGEQF